MTIATTRPVSVSLRIRVLERDGYRCAYCGRTSQEVQLHVDHILPRARGGSNESTNLVTACSECNIGKRDNLVALPDFIVVKPLPDRPRRAKRDPYKAQRTWRTEAERRYPTEGFNDLAWISGDARFASVSWCGPLTVALADTYEAAAKLLHQIERSSCGHACVNDHQMVDMAGEEAIAESVERKRMYRRAAHFSGCATCRYVVGPKGPGDAVERGSLRILKAGHLA